MRYRSLLVGGLLAAAFSLPAQEDEAAVYFSLNSDRPVRPGEAATVRVHAGGVDELQFRLYRVNEPLVFFEKLPGLHHFGGQVRRSPKHLTPLERFHAWKLATRAWMRDVGRAQFTRDNRASIRARLASGEQQEPPPAPAGTGYAAIPILNPQQLVRTWQQPLAAHRRWESVSVPVKIDDRGLYVLEATDGKKTAYTVLSVTELALIVKTTPGRILARVVDRQTGAPLADCPVAVIQPSKEIEAPRVRTNADGLADIPVKGTTEEDLAVAAYPRGEFAVAGVGYWNLVDKKEEQLSGVVYTDRPIYRPGHAVNFRAIVRTEMATGYRLPSDSRLPVRVENAEGEAIFDKKLPVSSFGTVNGNLELPEAAPLGYYSVRVGEGYGAVHGSFQVEEYRKPEYEVKVSPAQKRLVQGQSNKVTIEAKYFYGEPVVKAKVTVAVYQARWWRPWDLEDAAGDEDDEMANYAHEQVMDQSGELDEQGRFTITIPAERADFDRLYRVEARVTDASNREITGNGTFYSTQGTFFLDLRPASWVATAGKPVTLRVESRDYDGNPVGGVRTSIEVKEWRWRSPENTRTLTTLETTTNANGVGSVEYTPSAGGSVRLTASARTREGATVTDDSYLWVTGGEWSSYEAPERIQIVPDKKTYKAGDTAHVLVVTGRDRCDLWVSVEGRAMHKWQFIKATSPSVMVDVPIESAYEPNVYVEAVFVKDNRIFRGSKSLKVPPDSKRLKVDIRPSKNEFKPGEQGTYTVEARDNTGAPVQAEFSLGLVDEAIYALARDPINDLVNNFYGRLWNKVGTETSFYYYFYGEAGKRRMQLAQLRPPKWRAQLKPERMVEPKIRKYFPDTMFWVADLKTGADGRAEARVTFPDALTMWRATARGVTPDTRVGSAIQKNIVRKNLVLTMGTPRFFAESDEMVVPLIVRNYLAAAKTVRVTLAGRGVEIAENGPRELAVASKGEARTEFRVKAGLAREVVLTGKALTDEESDGVELTMPVDWVGVKLSEARSGSLKDTPGVRVQVPFPAGHRPATRTLEVSLAPSVAGTLFSALEYLTGYPYGCVEQTMSSFLPNIVVARAMKELNVGGNVNTTELQKKVRAGLDRLYSMHHEDGGWGWWTWDDTHPFMTAYVTAGLVDARDAGYKVDSERLHRARTSIEKQCDSLRDNNPDLRAYMVYALARAGGEAKPRLEKAWAERSAMSGYGLSLLGLAARELKDPRAAEIASMLEAKAMHAGTDVYWETKRDPLLDFPLDASPEATAFAVKFLAAQKPDSALLPAAVVWLINHRDQGYYWASTKQTAMVIFGLTDYVKQSGELRPDYTATVSVNGKQVLTRKFTAADALSATPVRVTVQGMNAADTNTVEITRSGSGQLYWSARAEGFVPAAQPIQRGSVPSITREYFLLSPSQEQGRVTYRMSPLAGDVRVGDLLAVRLTVKGAEGHYLLIEDPIPAGTELVNDDNRYELRDRPPWWMRWSERRELRDNRAAYFERHFGSRDERQFTHLLKVTHAGRFAVSPARVVPMYEPGSISTTEGRTLEVRPQ